MSLGGTAPDARRPASSEVRGEVQGEVPDGLQGGFHDIAQADASEAFLVALAQTGDRDAFCELARRRQSWIRNLLRRMCNDPVLADDLSQQTFLLAWQRIEQLKGRGRFGPWLRQIAATTFLQHVRRRDPLAGPDVDPDLGPAPATTPDLARDLDRALATLAPDARACVVLAFHERMTHPEIARQTGLPLGTVKSHITRGARQLRDALKDWDPSRGSKT